MQWPVQLLRLDKKAYKNQFGHVLVIAGSPSMLGAAALTGLASMRAGAGITTVAVPKSLNLTLQKKVANVIMTLPLPETKEKTVSLKAFDFLSKFWGKYSAVVIGPGMTTALGTTRFIQKLYRDCPIPMVVDADALNCLANNPELIGDFMGTRILTPHMGEMSRLTGLPVKIIASNRKKIAQGFVKRYGCVIVLKGYRSLVVAPGIKTYVNMTGNPSMATAGSGDVLAGMIAALLAQGILPFESAKFAVWWHGKAGDAVVWHKKPCSIIATDLIESLGKCKF